MRGIWPPSSNGLMSAIPRGLPKLTSQRKRGCRRWSYSSGKFLPILRSNRHTGEDSGTSSAAHDGGNGVEEHLHTEQVISGRINPTTVQQVQNPQIIIRQGEVALPNAKSAQAYQQGVLGANGGPYNAATNSCVTHVANVLNAGGLDLPTATRAAIVALRLLMGG